MLLILLLRRSILRRIRAILSNIDNGDIRTSTVDDRRVEGRGGGVGFEVMEETVVPRWDHGEGSLLVPMRRNDGGCHIWRHINELGQ